MKGVKMNNKTKLLVSAAVLLITAQTALAVRVVSDVKLTDGTHIRKCQFNNGVVKYCSQEDAINDMRAFNNFSLIPEAEVKKTGQQLYKMTGNKSFLEPPKYNNSNANEAKIKAENAKKEAEARNKAKAEAAKLQQELELVTPTCKIIRMKINEYKNEYNTLSDSLDTKEQLGLNVDRTQLELLKYKISLLYKLFDEIYYNTNVFDEGYYKPEQKYIDIKNAYKSGKISEEEFAVLIKDLKAKDNKMATEYQKIIALTKIPLSANASFNNVGNSQQFSDTKIDKARKGVGTGVNILNDTMNSVRSIQSMFGI